MESFEFRSQETAFYQTYLLIKKKRLRNSRVKNCESGVETETLQSTEKGMATAMWKFAGSQATGRKARP